MKTRESLLTQTHLCKSEIKLLFSVSKSVASAVFDVAHQTDLAELGRPRMFYYGKKGSHHHSGENAGSEFKPTV